MSFLFGFVTGSWLSFLFLTKDEMIKIRNRFLFKIIDLYTQAEIFYKNNKHYVPYYVNKYAPKLYDFICLLDNYLSSDYNVDFEVVKDGAILNEGFILDSFKNKPVTSIEDYDFVVYTDKKSNQKNRIIYRHQLHFDYDYKLNNTNFVFVSVSFDVDNSEEPYTFQIHFKTDTYNYHIVDNSINSNFMHYFLNKHYGREMMNTNIEWSNYKLKIIDSDINVFELTKNDSLYFNENSFTIVR